MSEGWGSNYIFQGKMHFVPPGDRKAVQYGGEALLRRSSCYERMNFSRCVLLLSLSLVFAHILISDKVSSATGDESMAGF